MHLINIVTCPRELSSVGPTCHHELSSVGKTMHNICKVRGSSPDNNKELILLPIPLFFGNYFSHLAAFSRALQNFQKYPWSDYIIRNRLLVLSGKRIPGLMLCAFLCLSLM